MTLALIELARGALRPEHEQLDERRGLLLEGSRSVEIGGESGDCSVSELAHVFLRLPSGAELRTTRLPRERVVVCVNGGRARELPGSWSSSLRYLVETLAPRFPQLGFAELRYRVKSWRRLELCVEDAREAIAAAAGERTLLLGFSMGGAVSIAAADAPGVVGVLGLAPWIPERLDLRTLAGRRLDVLHGSLDRSLPGIPGVSSASSRRAFERAQALAVEGSYTLIRGGVHGLALRAPWGGLVPLPRARAWARLCATQLEAFAG